MQRSAFSHILLWLILHSSFWNTAMLFFLKLYRVTGLSQFLWRRLVLFSSEVVEIQERKEMKYFIFRCKLPGVTHGPLTKGPGRKDWARESSFLRWSTFRCCCPPRLVFYSWAEMCYSAFLPKPANTIKISLNED